MTISKLMILKTKEIGLHGQYAHRPVHRPELCALLKLG